MFIQIPFSSLTRQYIQLRIWVLISNCFGIIYSVLGDHDLFFRRFVIYFHYLTVLLFLQEEEEDILAVETASSASQTDESVAHTLAVIVLCSILIGYKGEIQSCCSLSTYETITVFGDSDFLFGHFLS